MGALTQARMTKERRFSTVALPLALNATAWQGGRAAIDVVAGTAKPAASGNTNLKSVGEWGESQVASASVLQPTLVNLDHEVVARWYDNVTGANAVVTLFTTCYMLDDHTVTNSSGGNAAMGRVWALDAIDGVLVETLDL